MKQVNKMKTIQVKFLFLSFLLCLFSGDFGFFEDVKAKGKIEIKTVSDLNRIRECLTCDYVLMNDIDLTFDTSDVEGVFFNEGLGWNPIGTFNSPFEGSFDGNGFKIIGLKINRNQNYVGLFSRIARTTNKDKKVENLILEDVDIRGNDYVGAIAGNIEYAQVDQLSISGSIEGRMYVGGVTGYTYYASIKRVYSKANIIGLSTGIGGVLGRLGRNSEIRDVHVEGNIEGTSCQDSLSTNCSVGGIVGRDESSSFGIFTSFFNGQLVYRNPYELWVNSQKYAQPILGLSYGSLVEFNYHTVNNPFFLEGYISSDNLTSLSYYENFDFEDTWELIEEIRLQNIYVFNSNEVYEVGIKIIEQPFRKDYLIGEDVSIEGMVVVLQFSDGSSTELSELFFNGHTNQAGNQIITITYRDFTDTFVINVIEPFVPKIDVEFIRFDREMNQLRIKVTSEYFYDLDLIVFDYRFSEFIGIESASCSYQCSLSFNKNNEFVIVPLSETTEFDDSLEFVITLSNQLVLSQSVVFEMFDIRLFYNENLEVVLNDEFSFSFFVESSVSKIDTEIPDTSNKTASLNLVAFISLILGLILVINSYKIQD